MWEFQTGSGINAQPVTYTHRGRQYVTVLSGIGGLYWNIAREQLKDKVPPGGSGTISVHSPGRFGTRANGRLSWEAHLAPMKCIVVLLVVAAMCTGVLAEAQGPQPQSFTPEQLATGADIYARNCSPCHGTRMLDPQGAFDLRQFPRDQRERFVTSVLRGKNQMPPWGEILKPEEIEALWGYVVGGEK